MLHWCLTLPYLTLPYLTLPYLTLPYLTLPYLTLKPLAGVGQEDDSAVQAVQRAAQLTAPL